MGHRVRRDLYKNSPCELFPSYPPHHTQIFQLYGLEEAQTRIKIARGNISNSDKEMTPPLWQKVKKN